MNGLLRIATGPSRYDYSRQEMEEISETIDAIQHLSERIKTLDKKDRITMLTHGGRKKVWHIESGTLRDRQVYVDRSAIYTQMDCGAIERVPLRAGGGLIGITGIRAEELSFLARFI